MKIARLEREVELLKTSDHNAILGMPKEKFSKFSKQFDTGTLKTLRTMPNDSQYDRSFIRTALEFLYLEKLHLQNKSLFGGKPKTVITKSGIAKVFTEKMPLTPEKVDLLSDIYYERITSANLSESELTHRTKASYRNQLIATGLSNIQRKNTTISEWFFFCISNLKCKT